MMDFLRKHQYKITIALAAIMVSYIFVGLGGDFFLSKQSNGESIAEVNGEKIPLRIFNSHYRRSLDAVPPGQTLDDAARQQKRDETIRDLVQSIVFMKEAKRYGIEVPDQQVVTSLAQIPAFQEKGQFSPRLYVQALQSQLRITPQDFEEEQRTSVAFFKLRWLIQSCIKVTDKEAALEAAFKQNGKPFKTPAEREKFMDQLWQEKILYSFNQWFSQLGRNLNVKTHFELLEGQR